MIKEKEQKKEWKKNKQNKQQTKQRRKQQKLKSMTGRNKQEYKSNNILFSHAKNTGSWLITQVKQR